MSDESITPPVASNNSLAPALIDINTKLQVKPDCHCLKEVKVTFKHKEVVNIYIVYEISLWPYTQGVDFTLGNSLFGAIKLTKNADPDKYSYYEYGIGSDARRIFLISDGGEFGKNAIIFGANMSILTIRRKIS